MQSNVPQWLPQAFVRAVQAAGSELPKEELVEACAAILQRWSSPDRHYHGLQHLIDTAAMLEELVTETHNPHLVRLAVWYHGVVFSTSTATTYMRNGGEDEAASAIFAHDDLKRLGVDGDSAERVAQLVKGIRSNKDCRPCDTSQFDTIDIDLLALRDAHLGTLAVEPQRYKRYTECVRQEYAHIPMISYLRARKTIIERLLDRPSLFATPLAQQWEEPTRENMNAELIRISSKLEKLEEGEWSEGDQAGMVSIGLASAAGAGAGLVQAGLGAGGSAAGAGVGAQAGAGAGSHAGPAAAGAAGDDQASVAAHDGSGSAGVEGSQADVAQANPEGGQAAQADTSLQEAASSSQEGASSEHGVAEQYAATAHRDPSSQLEASQFDLAGSQRDFSGQRDFGQPGASEAQRGAAAAQTGATPAAAQAQPAASSADDQHERTPDGQAAAQAEGAGSAGQSQAAAMPHQTWAAQAKAEQALRQTGTQAAVRPGHAAGSRQAAGSGQTDGAWSAASPVAVSPEGPVSGSFAAVTASPASAPAGAAAEASASPSGSFPAVDAEGHAAATGQALSEDAPNLVVGHDPAASGHARASQAPVQDSAQRPEEQAQNHQQAQAAQQAQGPQDTQAQTDGSQPGSTSRHGDQDSWFDAVDPAGNSRHWNRENLQRRRALVSAPPVADVQASASLATTTTLPAITGSIPAAKRGDRDTLSSMESCGDRFDPGGKIPDDLTPEQIKQRKRDMLAAEARRRIESRQNACRVSRPAIATPTSPDAGASQASAAQASSAQAGASQASAAQAAAEKAQAPPLTPTPLDTGPLPVTASVPSSQTPDAPRVTTPPELAASANTPEDYDVPESGEAAQDETPTSGMEREPDL